MLQTQIRPAQIQASRAYLKSMISLVRLSRTMADAGRAVRFNGVEDNIACLYETIANQPPEAVRLLYPEVIKLAAELNSLLAAHGDMIPTEIQGRIRSYVTTSREGPPLM